VIELSQKERLEAVGLAKQDLRQHHPLSPEEELAVAGKEERRAGRGGRILQMVIHQREPAAGAQAHGYQESSGAVRGGIGPKWMVKRTAGTVLSYFDDAQVRDAIKPYCKDIILTIRPSRTSW